MNDKPDVVIELRGHFAKVTPGMAELIGQWLSYTSNRFVPGGPRGYQRIRSEDRAFSVDESGALTTRVGLVSLVEQLLRDAGVHARINDLRGYQPDQPGTNLEIDRHFIETLPAQDRQFLHVVCGQPKGIIELADAAAKTHAMALLCRCYPRARVLIPMSTKKEIRRLHQELSGLLQGQIKTLRNWNRGVDLRLICGQLYLHCAMDYSWDLILLPNVSEFVPSHAKALLFLDGVRTYSFLPCGRKLSANYWTLLQFYCGPFLYARTLSRGLGRDKVAVLWLQAQWAPVAHAAKGLERKRQAYWHNAARNRSIAEVALAFRNGNKRVLWSAGLGLEDGAELDDAGEGPSVTILVESPEHGRELLGLLPGWNLRDMTPGREQSCPPMDFSKPADLKPWDKIIVTTACASVSLKLETDVLIRATGTEWPLKLSFCPAPTFTPRSKVLLVDVADDFDNAAKRATQGRCADYRARGWQMGRVPSWLRFGCEV